jgi:hypothetical protein
MILAVAAVLVFGAGAQPGFAAARNVDVRTTDSGPVGRLTVTISWSGKRHFSGRIYGHVHDRDEDDKHAVHGYALLDGQQQILGAASEATKPFPTRAKSVNLSFANKHQVLVRVCGVTKATKGHPSRDVSCSDWK